MSEDIEDIKVQFALNELLGRLRKGDRKAFETPLYKAVKEIVYGPKDAGRSPEVQGTLR